MADYAAPSKHKEMLAKELQFRRFKSPGATALARPQRLGTDLKLCLQTSRKQARRGPDPERRRFAQQRQGRADNQQHRRHLTRRASESANKCAPKRGDAGIRAANNMASVHPA